MRLWFWGCVAVDARQEQAAIEARLAVLVGVEKIQAMLKRTTISGDNSMKVDAEISTEAQRGSPQVPTLSRTVETKRRILSSYVCRLQVSHNLSLHHTVLPCFRSAARCSTAD